MLEEKQCVPTSKNNERKQKQKSSSTVFSFVLCCGWLFCYLIDSYIYCYDTRVKVKHNYLI